MERKPPHKTAGPLGQREEEGYHCFSTPFQVVDLFGTTSQNMRELRLQIGKERPEPGCEFRRLMEGTNQTGSTTI